MDPWVASAIAILASAGDRRGDGLLRHPDRPPPLHRVARLHGDRARRSACSSPGPAARLFTLPPEFKFIGQGSIGVIPFVIIIFVVFVVVFDFLLRRSTAFRKVFYTGSNEKAAAYSGIRTKRVIFFTTVLCSTLCGVAGIIYMARFGSAQPTFGIGMELNVIAAAVIGGASLSGGAGHDFRRDPRRGPAVGGVELARPARCLGLLAGHHPRLDPARRRVLRPLPSQAKGDVRVSMRFIQ